MIPGLSGSLLSHDVLTRVVPGALRGLLGEEDAEAARSHLRSWYRAVAVQWLGPAVSDELFDRLAEPLMSGLGYEVVPTDSSPERFRASLAVAGAPCATLLVTPWGQVPASAWRDAVRLGIGQNGRWCFCLLGTRLRIVDASGPIPGSSSNARSRRRSNTRRRLQFSGASCVAQPWPDPIRTVGRFSIAR